MAAGANLREVADRVEGLLAELRDLADPAARAAAEGAVRLLVELYGAGLERVVDLATAGPDGPELLDRLAADELVGSLLIVHGLHPHSTEERIQRALDRVRPYLGSHAGGIELLGVDEGGVAHLRLQGSCDGCPSSLATVKLAVERAIEEAAPELTGIDVEGVAEAPGPAGPELLQIQPLHRPAGWTTLPGVTGLLPGERRVVEPAGIPVLVCSAEGSLYAYRNACAGCGAGLDEAVLDGPRLRCQACGQRFDVTRAGRGLDDDGLHLEPLPLLADGGEVRVAVPQRVGA
jgi:Fe-S cluster biogenesis protein NfuA/nitrite reductase/ring-hydroxylating ferredoxin subunit